MEATQTGSECAAGSSACAVVALDLPCEPESIGKARDAVTGLARAAGFADTAVSAVAVAVSEAATNVVVHAYNGTSRGPLLVRAELAHGELRVAVSDEGPGIRPRFDSPGLGMGIPLIAALASHVEIGQDELGRTCMRMRFGRATGPVSLRTTGDASLARRAGGRIARS
jgi:anti-sigma regulatory factor (Ser/Thr protein kinase)